MEFPEPWHRYDFEDWPRLELAIHRLNSCRKRKGLSPLDPRPPARAPRIDGEVPSGIVPQSMSGGGSAYGHGADQLTFKFTPTEIQAKAKPFVLKKTNSQQ